MQKAIVLAQICLYAVAQSVLGTIGKQDDVAAIHCQRCTVAQNFDQGCAYPLPLRQDPRIARIGDWPGA